ncbi:T9SS type A sorting domain-containing protein [Aquimarina sp. ERC-38]|uniref:hypothetical protein n=1 Tax=Aquimarina sp. ERC-38 TaxID=2949996 RepID=UPI0022483DE2|nr:hypothetical protein [Aquimarina sp. ERC-38]UZO82599.1 T9SS type A sorting domain-containing protein [Aquimarina sp. ERC-38]
MTKRSDATVTIVDTPIIVEPTLSIGDYMLKKKFTAFYPNPVREILYVTDSVRSQEYRILNISGSMVESVEASTTLDISD